MDGHRQPFPNVREFERKLDWFSRSDRPKSHVFDGMITALQLRQGFGLHTLNATARQRFDVTGHRSPGVVLHCFLEGSTDALLGGKPMNLGRRPGEPVKMVMTSVDEIQQFSRRSEPDQYVRKVSIQMSHDWLAENGLLLPKEREKNPMRRLEWTARMEEIQVLERLANTPGFGTPVARLQAEAMSLGLVARCFEAMDEPKVERSLTKRELRQLRRIEKRARQQGPIPTLQDLASEGGVSQSNLRRLIQATYGRSPLAHVRQIRLELARKGLEEDNLSIEEAAEMVGYTSSANFATAFRRAFGMTPSQVSRQWRCH